MSIGTKEHELLTIKEAAESCNVHPNTIRNLIQRGELPAQRIGARIIRISSTDLFSLFTPYAGGEYGSWNSK